MWPRKMLYNPLGVAGPIAWRIQDVGVDFLEGRVLANRAVHGRKRASAGSRGSTLRPRRRLRNHHLPGIALDATRDQEQSMH